MKNLKWIFFVSLPFLLIGFYLLYYQSYKKQEATNEQVNAYIKNSKLHTLNKVTVISDSTKQYTHFFSTASYPKSKLIVLIKTEGSNKYFALEEYNNKQSIISLETIGEGIISVKINEKEYNDTQFGTLENPVPILYFKDVNNPQDIYVTDAQYQKNVQEYLTYDKKVNSKK